MAVVTVTTLYHTIREITGENQTFIVGQRIAARHSGSEKLFLGEKGIGGGKEWEGEEEREGGEKGKGELEEVAAS